MPATPIEDLYINARKVAVFRREGSSVTLTLESGYNYSVTMSTAVEADEVCRRLLEACEALNDVVVTVCKKERP